MKLWDIASKQATTVHLSFPSIHIIAVRLFYTTKYIIPLSGLLFVILFGVDEYLTRVLHIYNDNSSSAVVKIKVNQSHYRPEVPRGFQEVKVPRLCDSVFIKR